MVQRTTRNAGRTLRYEGSASSSGTTTDSTGLELRIDIIERSEIQILWSEYEEYVDLSSESSLKNSGISPEEQRALVDF